MISLWLKYKEYFPCAGLSELDQISWKRLRVVEHAVHCSAIEHGIERRISCWIVGQVSLLGFSLRGVSRQNFRDKEMPHAVLYVTEAVHWIRSLNCKVCTSANRTWIKVIISMKWYSLRWCLPPMFDNRASNPPCKIPSKAVFVFMPWNNHFSLSTPLFRVCISRRVVIYSCHSAAFCTRWIDWMGLFAGNPLLNNKLWMYLYS